ncbi:MAG: helix-turn-helix domain-containing protein [Chitinophagales bacterium]|nr:helix-turn-helix domain-containing protein [Chitinophagales bacterium]
MKFPKQKHNEKNIFKTNQKSRKMKTYKLDEVTDKIIGKKGTPKRDRFEYELQMDLIGKAIKESRQERNLTQEQLGELVGVQKAQISRLESNASNVTLDTLMKVFTALKAKVKLQVELPNAKFKVAR